MQRILAVAEGSCDGFALAKEVEGAGPGSRIGGGGRDERLELRVEVGQSKLDCGDGGCEALLEGEKMG